MAGANSIFTGDKLLTTGNAGDDKDAALFAKLGIVPMRGVRRVILLAMLLAVTRLRCGGDAGRSEFLHRDRLRPCGHRAQRGVAGARWRWRGVWAAAISC